jgi:hypothetical protein
MMARSFSLLLILVLTSVGAFAAERTVQDDSNRQEMLKLIAQPLLSESVAQAPASFYGPDNLYQYMDGGADIFVLYGVRTLLHQECRAKEVDVTVDIFDMGSPDTAFGMYAAERSPTYHFVTIGAEGYQDEGVLNFLQDRYYVKLAGFGAGADAVLATFARVLSARIGANSAFPALLARLPSKNRKPHSEQYTPNDPLGHPFLGPAYVVAYTSGGQESKLFVTLARDEADAQQRFKQLEEHFSKTGQCKAAPELGQGVVRASNSFEGAVMAQLKGRYLFLLVNPAAGGEQLLRVAVATLE